MKSSLITLLMIILTLHTNGYINEFVAECMYKHCAKPHTACMTDFTCSNAIDCLFECRENGTRCQENCYLFADYNYNFYKMIPCLMNCMVTDDIDTKNPEELINTCEDTCKRQLTMCASDYICADAFNCANNCPKNDYACYGLCLCHANQNEHLIHVLSCFGTCLNSHYYNAQ